MGVEHRLRRSAWFDGPPSVSLRSTASPTKEGSEDVLHTPEKFFHHRSSQVCFSLFSSPYRQHIPLRLKKRAADDGEALAEGARKHFQNRQTIKLRRRDLSFRSGR
jgi:hypothetical protein